MTATFQTQTYNGWSNYQTWNVSLWLQNDAGLYRLCLEYGDFNDVIDALNERGITQTPDGVSYTDPAINRLEINEHVFDCDENGDPL